MSYEVVRMPKEEAALAKLLEEVAPFLNAMYDETDKKMFGELAFSLEYWLFLWDNDAGFFVINRDATGKLLSVAMVTKYKSIWHGRMVLEVQRTAVSHELTTSAEQELDEIIKYLLSIAGLLNFDLLYLNTRDNAGNEHKRLVWRSYER